MMKNIEWALSVLQPFVLDKSYGEVTFTVLNGEIVNAKIVKSEKPPVDTAGQKA